MAAKSKVLMAISVDKVLEVLDAGESSTEWVLSAYLDTTPMRVVDRAYLSSFRTSAKEIRATATLQNGLNSDAAGSAIALVETYLAEDFAPTGAGLAIFADKDHIIQIAALPVRPDDEVHWAPRPVIEPLREAMDNFERIAVVLFDKEQTRYFSIFLGDIDHQTSFTDDVPGKQAGGGWFGLSQKRYQRHHDDHVLRHAKRTIALLGNELTARPFDRLFIGGPDEAVSVLRHHLPKRLEQRVAGSFGIELFATDADVLRAALQAGELAEQQQEVADIQALFENRSDHVVMGPENTFEALHLGKVDGMYMAKEMPRHGGKCVECGRLSRLDPCPVCMGTIEPVDDIGEAALELAAGQGARVDIVTGQASEQLMTVGGIGARTRHSER